MELDVKPLWALLGVAVCFVVLGGVLVGIGMVSEQEFTVEDVECGVWLPNGSIVDVPGGQCYRLARQCRTCAEQWSGQDDVMIYNISDSDMVKQLR